MNEFITPKGGDVLNEIKDLCMMFSVNKLKHVCVLVFLFFSIPVSVSAQFNVIIHNQNDSIVVPTDKVDSVSLEVLSEMEVNMRVYKTVNVLIHDKDDVFVFHNDSTLVDSLQNEVDLMKDRLEQVLSQNEKLNKKISELEDGIGAGVNASLCSKFDVKWDTGSFQGVGNIIVDGRYAYYEYNKYFTKTDFAIESEPIKVMRKPLSVSGTVIRGLAQNADYIFTSNRQAVAAQFFPFSPSLQYRFEDYFWETPMREKILSDKFDVVVQGSAIALEITDECYCPNTGCQSLKITTLNPSENDMAIMSQDISNVFTASTYYNNCGNTRCTEYSNLVTAEGYLSFWMMLPTAPSAEVNMRLTNNTSIIVSSREGGYNVALNVNGDTFDNENVFVCGDWYNIMLHVSPSIAEMWYRESNCGSTKSTDWDRNKDLTHEDKGWKILSIDTIVNNSVIDTICVSVKTTAKYFVAYIDDIYFDKTNLDDVSYKDGCIQIIRKSDLACMWTTYTDNKLCECDVIDDLLVVAEQRGISVWDVSDVASPKKLYWYRTKGEYFDAQGVKCYKDNHGNKFAAISRYSAGLVILNLNDKKNIRWAASYLDSFRKLFGRDFTVYGFDVCVNYPYVYGSIFTQPLDWGKENDVKGIFSCDISGVDETSDNMSLEYSIRLAPMDKEDYSSVESGTDSQPCRIECFGNSVVCPYGDKGLAVWDITDKANPVYQGLVNNPYYCCPLKIKTRKISCPNCL